MSPESAARRPVKEGDARNVPAGADADIFASAPVDGKACADMCHACRVAPAAVRYPSPGLWPLPLCRSCAASPMRTAALLRRQNAPPADDYRAVDEADSELRHPWSEGGGR